MADFERIEIDPTTSEARFERSDFAQVIFHNILETYTTEANIDCAYTITPNLVPTPKDWIGLYRYEYVMYSKQPFHDSSNGPPRCGVHLHPRLVELLELFFFFI